MMDKQVSDQGQIDLNSKDLDFFHFESSALHCCKVATYFYFLKCTSLL